MKNLIPALICLFLAIPCQAEVIIVDPPAMQWHKGHGTSYGNHVHEGMQTSDGGYIGIGQTSDSYDDYPEMLVIKTYANGNKEWQKVIGTTNQPDIGICIAEVSDGYICGGGLYDSTNMKRALVKLDFDGNIVSGWPKYYSGSQGCAIRGIDILGDGSIVATGYKNSEEGAGDYVFIVDDGTGFIMKTDADGIVIWDKGLSVPQGTKVRQISTGFAVCSTALYYNGGDHLDAVLIKTDSSGNETNKYHYGGSGTDDFLYDFDLTSDGGYILGGHTRSYGVANHDYYLVKVNSIGIEEWHQTFGQPRGYDPQWIHDEAYGVRQTPDGGYIIAGGSGDEYAYSECGHPAGCSGEWKAYLVKTDPDGNLLWQDVYPPTSVGNTAGEYLGLTSDGGYIVFTDTDAFWDTVGSEAFGFMKIAPDTPYTPPPPLDLLDGLLVAHDFSDLVDDSGNGHNAVLGGSAYISGGLLYLQGDGGYADIGPETFGPVNPIVDGLSDFTIAIAYASTNTGWGGESGGGMLLNVGPIATAARSGDFSLFTNNDGQYIDHWWVTARGSDQSGVGYADGTVHLAIVTYEATTDTYTFYHLDGGAAVSHGSVVFPDWSAAWNETLDYTPRIGTSANVNVDLDFGPAGDGAWAYLDGQVDMVAIWNRVLTISEIPKIPDLAKKPDPPDGAIGVRCDTVLSWTTEDTNATFDVYFGTSSSPPLVSTAQSQTSYDPPGYLMEETTYYWRIDQRDAEGSVIMAGNVWSFTTARVLYVDADAPGPTHDGLSWGTGYKYLQDALAAAVAGDELRVAEGIYKPDEDTANPDGTGDREATFQLISGVAIYGGYAGFDQPDPDARDIEVYETILSGDLRENDGPNFANNGDNSYHVVTGSWTNATALLDGFTITAGQRGVSCVGSSPRLENCVMMANFESGVQCLFSSPTITNCIISGSVGDSGINCQENSSPIITNCTIWGNSAMGSGGGGVYCNDSSPTIINCTIGGNSADNGGGMLNYESSPTLTNCTFSGNSSDVVGGGMANFGGSNPTLTNCTFTGNLASSGAGIFCENNSNPTITNCTISGNTASGGASDLTSYSFSQVSFNLRDISSTGTPVSLGDDQVSNGIALPFNFDFYGTEFSEIYISSNGFITFLSGQYSGCCSGQLLPTPGNPDGLVAGFWGDLYPPGWGTIRYQTLGTPGSREFIVGFYEVPHCCGSDYYRVTFEIILHEATNNIELQYGSAPSDDWMIHSVGIESPDGTEGLQVAYENVSFNNEGFLISRQTQSVGGGICCRNSIATVTNSILWSNTAQTGPQIYNDETSSATVSYSCVQGYVEPTEPAQGMIAHWTFDEGTGDIAYDSVGDNDGTIHGAQWTTGQLDGALSFDGVDDYVDVGNLGSFPSTGTIGFWMKPYEIANYRNPFTTDFAGDNAGIRFEESDPGRFVVVIAYSGTSCIHEYLSVGLQAETWYHVVLTWDSGSDNVRGYLDGLEKFDESQTNWPGTLPDVQIGRGYSTSSNRHWKGLIDDVSIYDRALSAEEIEQLYQSGSEEHQGQGNIGADPGFVNPEYLWPTSYLKLDEGQGDTAYDSTGDNDGTIYGAQWTTGQIDGALSFDGAGDYVAIQNLYYDSTGEIDEITVCGWCKSSSSNWQFITSFDRSEYWRLSLKDDMGTGNVGWDTTDSSRATNDLGTSTDYADGNWHYICGWFKKGTSPDKKIFVDGSQVASTTAHGGRSLGSGATRYGFIGVGSEASSFNGNTGPDYYFDGTIDDVRIYNRALSAEEIQQQYEIGLSGYGYPDVATPDYHLSSTSPCIDAGDNTAVPADTTDLDGDGNTTEPIPFDLDGNPRIVDGNYDAVEVVDMGAYEYGLVGCTLEPNNPHPRNGAIDVPMDTNLAWDIGGYSGSCDLANGGFEDDGFAQWTTVTGPGNELTPWNVSSGGTGWFQNGFSFEGGFFAQNGFDGDAGLFYDIYQEVTIPACASFAVLNWSERIQWNMIPYKATLPRQYIVSIQPAGGGIPLDVLYTMFLDPGTSGDTEYVSHSVNLLSEVPGIAGQTIRINFHEYIPESRTGPAQFDLDRIDTFSFTPAPEYPTTWDVYLSTDPCALELVCEDLNEPNLDLTPGPGEKLNAHTTYYWQVVAKNAVGETEGDEWSFTTENTPPVADAGPDQVVECASNTDEGTKVNLSGTNSSDPDGDLLTYTWGGSFDESPVHGPTPTVTLLDGCPGDYIITLVVNDGIEDSEPDDVLIAVQDTTPPALACPENIAVSGGLGGMEVSFDPSATDECDPNVVVTTDIPSGSLFERGVTTVTATAADASGNLSTCAFDVIVSCCGINEVKLETKAGKKGNKVELKGTFSPALPIGFAIDDVIYIIDDGQGYMLSFVIPAGSFEPDGEPEKQRFKFDSPKHSQPDIKAKFDFLKCKFELRVKGVMDTSEISGDSLAIVLQAGENPANLVEEVVQVQVKPEHLEYKREPKLSCCPKCIGIALLEITSDQGVLVFEPEPGKEKLKRKTVVDDWVNRRVKIDTSCSKPLEVGDVFGAYTVTELIKIFDDWPDGDNDE